MPEFELNGPITLCVRIGGGGAEIVAEERTNASVEVVPHDSSDSAREAAANTRVELHGDTLVVQAPEWTGWMFRRGPRVRVFARVPLDTTLAVKVSSADIRATGRYAAGSVGAASGDVYVEHLAGTASVNTASGDIRLDRVDGQLGIVSASGDVEIGRIGGDLDVKCASGDIEVAEAGASVRAKSASGDIGIGVAQRGAVRVHSASGDVRVGVATGTGVWLDLSSTSGAVHSDLTTDATAAQGGTAELTVQVRTISGDIDVVRAPVAPARDQVTRTTT
jgi:hypothetical protein